MTGEGAGLSDENDDLQLEVRRGRFGALGGADAATVESCAAKGLRVRLSAQLVPGAVLKAGTARRAADARADRPRAVAGRHLRRLRARGQLRDQPRSRGAGRYQPADQGSWRRFASGAAIASLAPGGTHRSRLTMRRLRSRPSGTACSSDGRAFAAAQSSQPSFRSLSAGFWPRRPNWPVRPPVGLCRRSSCCCS